MPKLRGTSPARSQGDIATPKRKKSRGSRSLCSPALSTASGRLTSLVDQFKEKNMESFALSPLNGKSVLTDDTDIQEPKRKSWWKKLNENSHILEVLEDNKVPEANNIIEEFIDIEVLSQEKKNFSLDLPESSDSESIDSIVLPQRKLFTQKDNLIQKKFGQLGGKRETLAKLHKTNTTNIDKTVNVGTRELFQNKRSKPVFPAALLNMSPNRTAADKTKENMLVDPKPQVRNIFGNRPAAKRKNMFADFIVSESEDEIPEIQPKVFGFQKGVEQRRVSSVSKGRDHSPTSSITTDMEMDDWRLLPSSTMVENQLEEMVAGHTPIKRARLSKLSEAKESETGTNTIQSNLTADKTKQSNKSVSSKNKSRTSPSKETLDNSRTTRSMTKNTSKYEEVNTSTKKSNTKVNKSQNKTANKDNKLEVSNAEKSQRHNRSKTRNSSKVMENEIVTDETNVANAINNATRVINKSTSKKLSSSQATNKTLKEVNKESGDNEEINIEAQRSNEEMEEDDENNLTLEYDEDEMEEAVAQNQQKVIKENVAILNKSIKNTTKADINKSKAQTNEMNESLNQKQKQSITVDESVESQSPQDNVDGNLEDEQNENDSKSNRESIEAANVSQTDNDANEEIDSKANASANEEEENAHEESDDSHNNQEIEQEADESQNDENQVDEVQEEDEQEVNESQEVEDDNNISQVTGKELENEEMESQEVEADESQGIEEQNDSHASNQVDDDEANESQEQEQDESQMEENAESDEEEQEVNVSQEVDESHVEEENESQEVANKTVEAVESEEEAAESEAEAAESEAEAAESEAEAAESEAEGAESEAEGAASEIEAAESEDEGEENEEEGVESDAGEEDADESIQADNDESEQLEANQSQEVNESQEIDNEENEDENESANEQVVDNDASDESDRAIASDPEMSDDDNQEEMEDDDENDQASNEAVAESEPNESEPLEGMAGQSTEEIEESPNVTHDTTGRNRKKKHIQSPEAILHDKTNQMDSFTIKGRNTSVRKTKSMIKNLDIRPSLAPRDSIGSNGTTNSTAEGSGWDSHRTTRKTLRQTFGKDFTPRKSLRAMVMEKSAKRQTEMMDAHYVTAKFPQANSTELPEDSNIPIVEDFEVSDHEVSKRTRQTTLEEYLEKMKQQNIEKKMKMEEAVRNSLKAPIRDTLSLFKVPSKPAPRRPKPSQAKPKKQVKSVIAFDELPSEVIEDMKYKPPKRFQPTNASWITKRLYKFLENKLEPNYDYKARVRAEKLVETIYHFAKDLRRHDVAPSHAVDVLKHELARLEVVNTHFEFYEFFHEFMPREVRVKVVPDIVNNIPLPRHGVFSAILRGNTVQG